MNFINELTFKHALVQTDFSWVSMILYELLGIKHLFCLLRLCYGLILLLHQVDTKPLSQGISIVPEHSNKATGWLNVVHKAVNESWIKSKIPRLTEYLVPYSLEAPNISAAASYSS